MVHQDSEVLIVLELKKNSLQELKDILIPHLYSGLRNTYREAVKMNRQEPLKMFQIILSRLNFVSANNLEQDYKYLKSRCSEEKFVNILKCHFVSTQKLNLIGKCDLSKIDFKVPKPVDFIHKCYISSARRIWSNAYLFSHKYSSEKQAENAEKIKEHIEKGIEQTIRELVPLSMEIPDNKIPDNKISEKVYSNSTSYSETASQGINQSVIEKILKIKEAKKDWGKDAAVDKLTYNNLKNLQKKIEDQRAQTQKKSETIKEPRDVPEAQEKQQTQSPISSSTNTSSKIDLEHMSDSNQYKVVLSCGSIPLLKKTDDRLPELSEIKENEGPEGPEGPEDDDEPKKSIKETQNENFQIVSIRSKEHESHKLEPNKEEFEEKLLNLINNPIDPIEPLELVQQGTFPEELQSRQSSKIKNPQNYLQNISVADGVSKSVISEIPRKNTEPVPMRQRESASMGSGKIELKLLPHSQSVYNKTKRFAEYISKKRNTMREIHPVKDLDNGYDSDQMEKDMINYLKNARFVFEK